MASNITQYDQKILFKQQ